MTSSDAFLSPGVPRASRHACEHHSGGSHRRLTGAAESTVSGMSAQHSEQDGHSVIHLGTETAVVVPLEEYRVLAALRDRATAEDVEDAALDAAITEHESWKAAGRPGGTIPHDAVMAELLGGAPE